MLRKKLRLSDEAPELVNREESITPLATTCHNTPLNTSPYFEGLKSGDKSCETKLILIGDNLNELLSKIDFTAPVAHVYNPTVYARDLYLQYIRRYGNTTREILFLGMNPGPYGMCQTGVPFGNVTTVSEWLQISGEVQSPDNPCPTKPIQGLSCSREEVSGKRFWAFFRGLCQTPEVFFKHAFVYNYCPLALVSAQGNNITPTEVRRQKQQIRQLDEACNEALVQLLCALDTKVVVAIGGYAARKVEQVLKRSDKLNVKILKLAHPSPRSLQSANWANTASDFLRDNNLTHFFTPPQ